MSATERRIRKAVLGGAVALAVLGTVVPSWANDDAARAQALFDGAVASMEAGHWEEACPKLAESDRLEASGGTALNLGYCFEHLGKLGPAYAAYVLAATHYESSHKPERVKVAREHADAIRDRVTIVHLDGPRDPGSDLSVDGDVRSVVDGTVVVDRGTHQIAVTVGGEAKTLPLTADAPDVTLAIPPPTVVVTPPPPVVVPPPRPLPPPPSANPKRTAAWIVGATGLAFVAGAIATGVGALSWEGTSDAACPGGQCSPEGVTAHDTARALALTTDVFIVTSVVAFGVATYLFLTSKPSPMAIATPLVFRF